MPYVVVFLFLCILLDLPSRIRLFLRETLACYCSVSGSRLPLDTDEIYYNNLDLDNCHQVYSYKSSL